MGQTTKKHFASRNDCRRSRGRKTQILVQNRCVVTMKRVQPCVLATDPRLVLPSPIFRRSLWTSCGLLHLVYLWPHNKKVNAWHLVTCCGDTPSLLEMYDTVFSANYHVFKIHTKTENLFLLVAVITPSRSFSTARISNIFALREQMYSAGAFLISVCWLVFEMWDFVLFRSPAPTGCYGIM